MSNISAFVIGHSHLKSIVDFLFPRLADEVSERTPIVYNVFDTGRFGADFQFSVSNGSELVLNPILTDLIKKRLNTGEHPIFLSMFGGNAHNAFSLLQHPTPFDFILPESPELGVLPGHEIVPYEYVYRSIRRYAELYLVNMACMAQSGLGKTYHIESPPPVGEDDYVLQHLETYFKQLTHNPVLSPRSLRYKFWRVHSNIVRDACVVNGIEFVPAPSEGTEHGFLAPDSYSGDSTHASSVYGGHVLHQMERILGARYNGWQWLL